MHFALSPEARAAGYRLESFDTVGSTNTEALARARSGETGPLWLASRHQSAGRGRRGSAWSTETGNLAASLLRVVDLPAPTIANLGFVAGVALIDALCKLRDAPLRAAPRHDEGRNVSHVRHAEEGRRPVSKHAQDFTLKWPNDVLAGGAKLAGILLETETLRSGLQAVVVGIGVNVEAAPNDLPYAATSLRSLGLEVTPEQLFAALSAAWVEAEAVWNGGRGFEAIRRLWLDRASGMGDEVRVHMPQRDVRGIFETIDEQGRLLVRSPGGNLTAIAAGEVHFPNAAAA